MPAFLTENLFIDVVSDAVKMKRQEWKEDKPLSNLTPDIHKVSSWTVAAWEEMTKNGYVDGTRPIASVTRERWQF